MKIKIIILSILICIVVISGIYYYIQWRGSSLIVMNERITGDGYIPENGFVPDEQTAIKLAEAVLYPIYGEKIYKKNRLWQIYMIMKFGLFGEQ